MTIPRHTDPSPDGFSPKEESQIAAEIGEGRMPACPRCGVPLDEWSVEPRADVSYVRHRLWLVCPSCRRSIVLDRRPRRPD